MPVDCRAAWSTCQETCPAPASCCAGLIRTLCEPGTAAKDDDAEEGDEVPEAEAEQGPTSSREAWCSVTTGAPCTAGRGTHAAAQLRGLARRHKFVCGSCLCQKTAALVVNGPTARPFRCLSGVECCNINSVGCIP